MGGAAESPLLRSELGAKLTVSVVDVPEVVDMVLALLWSCNEPTVAERVAMLEDAAGLVGASTLALSSPAPVTDSERLED